MRYRFAEFTADSELFELRRDGEAVPLQPMVLRLLLFLLEHSGRALTKDEIFAAVWPGVHVGEGSLTRAMSVLRRALGDRERREPVLRTVRGRGYRIGVPVAVGTAALGPGAANGADLPTRPSEAFVGRADLLEQLASAWHEVARLRRGRVALLAGAAGVGKTRLAEELAARLRGQGARVLQAWCDDGDGVPPFWPWAQLLRGYQGTAGPESFEADLGPDAPDLVDLLPERTVSTERRPRHESERDRFRLYDGLARFLCRAAAAKPLLVLIDDLHWADRSSLRALVFAAREIRSAPILLVGIYRDEEVALDRDVGELLAALMRQPGALRVPVPALSLGEVTLLAESLLGVRPSREQVGEI
jgi:DNA-binding winged helix-turn-helix (wHTH) protein